MALYQFQDIIPHCLYCDILLPYIIFKIFTTDYPDLSILTFVKKKYTSIIWPGCEYGIVYIPRCKYGNVYTHCCKYGDVYTPWLVNNSKYAQNSNIAIPLRV